MVHGVLTTRPPSTLAQGGLTITVLQACINMVFKSKSQLSPGSARIKTCRPCLDRACSLTEGLQTRNKAGKRHGHRDSAATNYNLQSL